MASTKRPRVRRISTSEAHRHYIRHFTDMPPALAGTAIEKETFLDAFTANALDVIGVQPKRRRARTI
ncbi:MAG: hypothetical protein OXR84_07790 [Magnetovibrio sp.]|nr:hypothetical protein [Magnetovibrio sp.]